MRRLSPRQLTCRLLAALGAWVVVAWPAAGRAQQATASGALGGGALAGQATATVDAGVDFAAPSWALGFGARVRWVLSDGLRGEDWDDRSELAALLRYFVYTRDRDDGVVVTAAAGELGGASLGRGAIIGGLTTGVDVDRRRLGVQVRVERARWGLEALVDDVVAPRVAGARGYWHRTRARARAEAGASAVIDAAAPTMDGLVAPAMVGTTALPMFALDGAWELRRRDGRLAVDAHADAVAIAALAAGLHVGTTATAVLGDADVHVALRAELRLGTDRYVAGWIGPLYERDRRLITAADGAGKPLLDAARAGGVGGAGSFTSLRVAVPTVGEAELSHARRPGLADVTALRVAAPHRERVQGALWMAVSARGTDVDALALSGELRARLPGRWFTAAELARLYRVRPSDIAAVWWLNVSVGATFDDIP